MIEYFKRKIEEYEKEVDYYREQITKAGAKVELLTEMLAEEEARNFTEDAATADTADTLTEESTEIVSSVY